MPDLVIAREDCADIEALQAFYVANGYPGQMTSDATVIVARDGGTVIGLVRLEPEHGLLVLRGMRVSEAYRRRGIGTRMLHVLAPECGNQDCYLIGHPWLDGFYGQIGFVKIRDEAVPPHLFERLMRYRRNGGHIPMLRARRSGS